MIGSIDHIVILVNELEQAIEDYTALGFTVVRGGDHPGGVTHNALVAFADGAYLELIAFKQPDQEHRWWLKGQRGGEGLVDYALLPGDIARDVAGAQARGLGLEGPAAGGRVRPDGQRIEWQTAHADASDLPFLCGDITPRSLRVPEGAARQHANGVLGVAAITIAVADLDASLARYGALLDGAPASPPALVAGLGIRMTAARLGGAQIVLAGPTAGDQPAGAALRRHLATRGEGPYAVAFDVEQGARAGMLAQKWAHGAPLELVARR